MNKSFPIIIAIIIVGVISAYALSPYFTESTIDEALPTGAIIQSDTEGIMEEMMDEEVETMEEMMDEEVETMEEMMDEEVETMEEMMDEEVETMEEMIDEEVETMEEMMDKSIPTSYDGTFIGIGDGIHDAQGYAYTIPLEDGSNVLRLENFRSTNGPDLYVYLSTDDNASEFINLGELKANKGNQNYEIPEDVDLSKYNKVLIWCKAFSVLFGSAELSS
ncbi:MAG: DM13 domain-containing protein [Candidatus Nitrosopelagicus sp.]|nr:DM13 domain-containing protein [Candidatus Nitrosopelagicus sp.]